MLCVVLGVVAAAGCDSRNSGTAEGDVDYMYEASKESHVIGFDPTGQPVYGVDANGNPVYKPEKQ